MYLYPAGIDDELIEAIAESDKIVPYVDMPIQHINNDILKSMRRSDTKEHTTTLIEKLRRAMPEVALRTTVIVGYPGETLTPSAVSRSTPNPKQWPPNYRTNCPTRSNNSGPTHSCGHSRKSSSQRWTHRSAVN
ncbi:MAG: radical SAM protein [Planctomycetota bacterium]|jgi:hypothetical protein